MINHHIVGLDVAMHDAFRMAKIKGLAKPHRWDSTRDENSDTDL